jgi:hypothetical protein
MNAARTPAPALSGPVVAAVPVKYIEAKADTRYTVGALPDDYRSQLDSSDCRGWAKAVAR